MAARLVPDSMTDAFELSFVCRHTSYLVAPLDSFHVRLTLFDYAPFDALTSAGAMGAAGLDTINVNVPAA